MHKLTANESSFVDMMGRSDEHTDKGFELLARRRNSHRFFDTIASKGFFDPQKNPEPRPADPGYIQIPIWSAPNYLLACARHAGEVGHANLANKIIQVIRNVTDRGTKYNRYTFYRFAEILGLLPTESVSPNDLERVEVWLGDGFDNGLVVKALDEGALHRFLDSDSPRDWNKALQLVDYCTEIRWTKKGSQPETLEPVTIVDPFWLKRLIDRHAVALGSRLRGKAAKLFERRVAQVFGRGLRVTHSHTFRPAVEADGQNDRGNDVDNRFVDGLRDILLSWCEHDVETARSFVASLLGHENQMLRRVGIFVLGQKWESLSELYLPVVTSELFEAGHLHELYGLLREHFSHFGEQKRYATIKAIKEIRLKPTGYREYTQLRWLSAFADRAGDQVERWFDELNEKCGPLHTNPDYQAYVETRWGHGRSEYGSNELIDFAIAGTIVEKLAGTKRDASVNTWDKPTVEALIDELEKAVIAAPRHFIMALPDFLSARREFQYGLIMGFLKPWRGPTRDTDMSEHKKLWEPLLRFLEMLLKDPGFWDIEDDTWQDVRPSWMIRPSSVAGAVADLLYYGTHDDRDAYPASLLPLGWSLIQMLIGHGDRVSEPSHDPMTQAINSPNGRAVEAAFSHVLRRCRIADREAESHTAVAMEVRTFLDQGLKDRSFEFSTLCGARILNLEYIDMQWLEANIGRIFPVDYPRSMICALGGLAYASITPAIYRMLRDTCTMSNVLNYALHHNIDIRDGRRALMATLARGYLWGEECLDSPLFESLFQSAHVEYLEMFNDFLRQIHRESLEPGQDIRIIDYWRHCTKWASEQERQPIKLLTSLAELTYFLDTAAGENTDPLIAVLPFVHTYSFIDELNRWVKGSPKEVITVLGRLIDTRVTHFSNVDGILTLVRNIADLGYREIAISYCNRLRAIPGIESLFDELTKWHQGVAV